MSSFDTDPFPDRPKILFFGWPNSPHTHSWVKLLKDADFNVRVFCLDSTEPPQDWWVKCYQTVRGAPYRDDDKRRTVFPVDGMPDLEGALAKVLAEWKPDVLHTLGIDPASFICIEMLKKYPSVEMPRWIVQARGGSDTMLPRHSPLLLSIIKDIFQRCDHFIADNAENYEFAQSVGLDPAKCQSPGMGPVPGPGGLDLEALRARWVEFPSQRERLIVWPKAHETPWAKANPVLEAIVNAWDQIKPCRIEMLLMDNPYLHMWYAKLFSEEMQESCVIRERVPHETALDLYSRARVMLAPTLVDGVPNSMMEAMALGAVPIVSPIETIVPVVEDMENVIFARNLYPDEITAALVRAMSDDALVDRIASNNLGRVRGLADRSAIQRRALEFYEEVCRQARQKYVVTGSETISVDRAIQDIKAVLDSSERERSASAGARAELDQKLVVALRRLWRSEVLRVAIIQTGAGRNAGPDQKQAEGHAAELQQLRDSANETPNNTYGEAYQHHRALIEVSGLFDAESYLSDNDDVARGGLDPLNHFLLYGGLEGRRPSAHFNSSRYLDENPDVKSTNFNPLVHFILYGLLEGRGDLCVSGDMLRPRFIN